MKKRKKKKKEVKITLKMIIKVNIVLGYQEQKLSDQPLKLLFMVIKYFLQISMMVLILNSLKLIIFCNKSQLIFKVPSLTSQI